MPVETPSTEWIEAPEGCPRFGLRGDDPEAPPTILFWAKQRRTRLLAAMPDSGELTDEISNGLAQCTAAEQIAWEMQAYQRTADMSSKGASYHVAKLTEAVHSIGEAERFARAHKIRIIPEIIARATDTVGKLLTQIKGG
jgi:hypothetical protein